MKLLILWTLIVSLSCCPTFSSEERFVRHDISAVASYLRCESTSREFQTNILAWVRPSENKVWKSYYKGEMELLPGVYVSNDLPVEGMNEWRSAKKIYMIIQPGNKGFLVLEDQNGARSFAPGSKECYWNENAIFFGPSNNGLCFYFQRGSNCLFTVFSPFGLQNKMRFDRLDKAFDLADVQGPKYEISNNPCFTNYLYYTVPRGTRYGPIDSKTQIELNLPTDEFARMQKKHSEKMAGLAGLYERNPDLEESQLHIEKYYLWISEQGEGDLIVRVDGMYFKMNTEGSILFDECLMNSAVYSFCGNEISIINVLSSQQKPHASDSYLQRFTTAPSFQQKRVYKRIKPFEFDVLQPVSRYYSDKKTLYENTYEWLYERKKRDN
jgi:hypothetical protein